jgi:arsenate reductase-like glutaredoxin family protein
MMMAQPNLIRRPILVRGSNTVFGFDKEKYRDFE